MTVKLWANWNEECIVTEPQMEEIVKEEYLPDAADDESFAEWLAAEYSNTELWYMEETDKADVRREFLDYAMDKAWETAEEDGWTVREVEI